MNKPKCKLTGQDGNVFNLIGIVKRTLEKAGLEEEAKEMMQRCFKALSYDEALRIMMEYVEVR
jgi:hypothetical protein